MIRFSPMADVRVFSFATLIDHFFEEVGVTPPVAASASAWNELRTVLADNYDNLFHWMQNILRENPNKYFKSIGLANDVRITEDYGTRSIYGIGQPTRPVIVPNNVAVGVSISRYTIDKKAVSNYVLKPAYWYEPRLQRAALDTMLAVNTELLGADYFFYTFLVLYDIETGGMPDDLIQALDNNGIIAFMPRNYNTPITSGASIITHSVTGEGKLLRLIDIVSIIVDTIAG